MGIQGFILNSAKRFGFEREILDIVKFLPGVEPYNIGRFVDDRIRGFESEGGAEDAVLIPLFPGRVRSLIILCTIGHAFRTRGHDVVLLGCDDEIPICSRENIYIDNVSSTRTICQFTSDQVCSAFGFTKSSISDILPADYSYEPPDRLIQDGEPVPIRYNSIDISGLSKSTLRKYYRAYNVGFSEESKRARYLGYLRSAAKMVDASNILLEEEDIIAAFAFHDNYVYGGSVLRAAANSGVPAYSVDVGYMDRSLFFGNMMNRSSLPTFTDVDVLEKALSKPLSADQSNRIMELIEKRAEGKGTRLRYSPRTDISVNTDENKILVSMFTNLSWDASLEIDDAPFPDMFEWIRATIDALGGREDVDLVVRTHPAEDARDTKESVAEWIKTEINPKPPNVTVLPADSDVNTYNLISETDLSIVYTSLVGLESVIRGVPTIVGGDAHYSKLAITYDPNDRAEYTGLLDNLDELAVTERNIELAKRYAHFFFFKKHLAFPFFEEMGPSEQVPFTYISHDRIKPGNANFDRLVEQATKGGPIFSGSSQASSQEARPS